MVGGGKVVLPWEAVDCFTRRWVAALATSLSASKGQPFAWVGKGVFLFGGCYLVGWCGGEFLGALGSVVEELKGCCAISTGLTILRGMVE